VPEGFGTADCVSFDGDGTLTVTDLKYGKGVRVNAYENEQLMFYGLGALAEFGFLYKVDTVKLVVHQPRLEHVDAYEIKATDLYRWGESIKRKAQLALSPNAPFAPSETACRWCKAKAICKPLAEKSLAAITHHLSKPAELNANSRQQKSNVTEFPVARLQKQRTLQLNAPDKLDGEQLGVVLANAGLVTQWLNAVKEYSLEQLNADAHSIPGFKVVEGRSTRQWQDHTAAETSLRKVRKLKVADIFNKKLISPAQAEKLLGKEHRIIREQVIKPGGKPVIVPNSDRRRSLDIIKEQTIEHDDNEAANDEKQKQERA